MSKNKKIRCSMSGKIVTPNKEVILKENLELYLEKQGMLKQQATSIMESLESE